DIAQTAPLVAHLLLRVYAARMLAAKVPDRASDVLDQAEQSLAASALCQPCSIPYQVAATITRAKTGNLTDAHKHLEKAERIAGMWHGGPWQAAVWEARGNLRRAEGDHSQGRALLAEAATLFGDSGRPLDAARCRASAT